MSDGINVTVRLQEMKEGLEIAGRIETQPHLRARITKLEERRRTIETMIGMDLAETATALPIETYMLLRELLADYIEFSEDFFRRH